MSPWKFDPVSSSQRYCSGKQDVRCCASLFHPLMTSGFSVFPRAQRVGSFSPLRFPHPLLRGRIPFSYRALWRSTRTRTRSKKLERTNKGCTESFQWSRGEASGTEYHDTRVVHAL